MIMSKMSFIRVSISLLTVFILSSCAKFEGVLIKNDSATDTMFIKLVGTHYYSNELVNTHYYNNYMFYVGDEYLNKTVDEVCPKWGDYKSIDTLTVFNIDYPGSDSNFEMIYPIKNLFHRKANIPYYRITNIGSEKLPYEGKAHYEHPTYDEFVILFHYINKDDSITRRNDSIYQVLLILPPEKQIRFLCYASGDASCSLYPSRICDSISIYNGKNQDGIKTEVLDEILKQGVYSKSQLHLRIKIQ